MRPVHSHVAENEPAKAKGAREGPSRSAAAALLQLQQSIGNAATSALVRREAGAKPQVKLLRDPLHGGPHRVRTTDEIERDAKPLGDKMGDALDHWKGQAFWGIQDFVNEELERRIDALRSAGLTTGSFLQSLAGNLIWAAACFIPGAPALAFAVSVAGIGIAAQASPPSASDPADKGGVSKLAEAVQGYLDKVEEEMRGENDGHLLEQAKSLVLFHDDLDLQGRLELFMTSNFPRSLLTPGVGGKLIRFNDEAVKKAQKQALKARFDEFVAAVSLVGTRTEPREVLGKKIGGEERLSLVAVSGVGGEGPGHVKYGIGYVIKPRQTDLQGKILAPGQVAIARWVADEVVRDVLARQAELKMPLIINAFATEITMGPDQYEADQQRQRELNREGGLRPG